jgi:hypothetical protein
VMGVKTAQGKVLILHPRKLLWSELGSLIEKSRHLWERSTSWKWRWKCCISIRLRKRVGRQQKESSSERSGDGDILNGNIINQSKTDHKRTDVASN